MAGVRTLLLLALVSVSGIQSAPTTLDPDCGAQADLVFLLDESGSVGHPNFNKMLDFVTQITGNFAIGPNDVQIGVETFSTTTRHQFFMNQYSNKAALEDAIKKIPYHGGNTHTGDALAYLTDHSFTKAAGMRDNVPHFAYVLTDGNSQQRDLTKTNAAKLQAKGVKVFAVGIGNGINDVELNNIASNPDSQYVFRAANFDNLKNLEDLLVNKACGGHGGTCKDALSNCAQYTQASCHDPYLNWAIINCPNYCNLCDRVGTVHHVTQPSFTSGGGNIVIHFTGCYYKGRVYRTGDAWSDGCEHHCTCINGHTGYYQCSARCQTYTNIPQGCILQKDPGACCETPHCSGTGNQTGTGIQIGTGSGCFYKGQTYGEDQTWNDGCTLTCTCEDAASSRYQCRQRCIAWTLPAACTIHGPAPGKCCKTPSCPVGYTISYPPGYKEE